jgi:hypothetical protein
VTPTATPSVQPGASPTATASPQPGVTPVPPASPGAGTGAAPPDVTLGSVAKRVRRGKVRGAVTVEPAGRTYTVTLRVKGRRAGRVERTSTGDEQRFAVRLSKAARRRLAKADRLRVTVLVRSGTLSAKRTVTVR